MVDVFAGEMVRSIEPMLGPQIRKQGLHYVHAQCDSTIRIRVDEDKLRQILLNLLSNAVKFTPMGGTVSVACHRDDMHVHIAVGDTGVGIAPNKLDHIFEPFTQVDRTLSTSHEGVGLGLAISRDLARAMGGDIAVSSVLDRGTTFTLTFPSA